MQFRFWLVLCLLTIGIEAGSGMQDMAGARQAYFQANLDKTIKLLKSAYADTSLDAQKKSEASRNLGTLHWRYKNENQHASDWFDKAIETGDNLDGVYRARTKFYFQQGNFVAAREDLLQAEKFSDSINSRLATLKLRFALVLLEAENGTLTTTSRKEAKLLLDVAKIEMQEKPYDFLIANKAIGLAIINNNLPAMINAWHNYFNASSKQGLAQSIINAGTLISSLSGEKSIQGLSSKQFQTLVMALGQSRFFEHLQLLDRARLTEKSKAEKYFIYSDFLKQLKNRVDEHYRLFALKEVDHNKLYEHFTELNLQLAEKLNWQYEGIFSKDTVKLFKPYLEQEFGVHYALGNTSGVISLHYGHSMIDETRTMVQYGNSVDFRYTNLAFLPSNGYHSWFWNGHAASGGWATASQIIRVKDEYVPNTNDWEVLMDKTKSEEFKKSLADAEKLDLASANDSQITYQASVSKRMKLKALKRLLKIAEIAENNQQQQLKFVNLMAQMKLENDIYIHESRHTIDQTLGIIPGKKYPAEVLEFRAKLSELALGPVPDYALSRIMSSNIGDGTGHGTANQKIIKGYVDWMVENTQQVVNIDPKIPLILQIDKLSIEQIRAIAKLNDPLVNSK